MKIKSFKCICCGVEIEPINSEDFNPNNDKLESWMWNGGTVEKITMPYGSNLDGSSYYIGICDDCIENKLEDEIIEEIKY